VAVGVVLVPPWGATGAAAAVLLASGLYAGLQYVSVCNAILDPAVLPLLAKFAGLAALGVLVMVCAPAAPALLVGTIVLAVSAIGIWAGGVFGRDDLDRMAGLLGARQRELR
jgi:O-antigen/teichoic acid export membrane protein